MEIVFNEISGSEEKLDLYKINELMVGFLETISSAKKSGKISNSLITAVDLNYFEICKGYYVYQWRNSSIIEKDIRRLFLSLCDHQRIQSPENDKNRLIQCDDFIGKGLLIAYDNDLLLISLPSSDIWKQTELKCTLFDYIQESESSILLKNVYCPSSIDEQQNWLNEKSNLELSNITTSKELEEALPTRFPSLCFHDNAIRQLRKTSNPNHIKAIIKELLVLENYFSTWNGELFDLSCFPNRYISPESGATLQMFEKEHTFTWNNTKIIVSYHIRYTGVDDPGRIYIYPLNNCKKCLICSLKTKLPTVSDPHFH